MPSAPSAAAERKMPPMLSGLITPSSARSVVPPIRLSIGSAGGRRTSATQPRWKLKPVMLARVGSSQT
jgi:hypothetical protein